MSILVSDSNNADVQCFRMPITGQTTNITTAAAGSAPSGALIAGVYRVISNVDVTVCQGTVAAATDMPMRADIAEYFYVNAGDQISAYDAGAGGGIVALTRMP